MHDSANKCSPRRRPPYSTDGCARQIGRMKKLWQDLPKASLSLQALPLRSIKYTAGNLDTQEQMLDSLHLQLWRTRGTCQKRQFRSRCVQNGVHNLFMSAKIDSATRHLELVVVSVIEIGQRGHLRKQDVEQQSSFENKHARTVSSEWPWKRRVVEVYHALTSPMWRLSSVVTPTLTTRFSRVWIRSAQRAYRLRRSIELSNTARDKFM